MKYFNSFIKVIWVIVLLLYAQFSNVYCHGFSASTLMSNSHVSVLFIKELCYKRLKKKCYVQSYDLSLNTFTKRRIKSVGQSTTDYCISINFNHELDDDIVCSLEQEFYLPLSQQWVPAYALRVDDCLLSKNGSCIPITSFKIIYEKTDLYAITLNDPHTYFVGRHHVLTHNMFLPVISLGLGTTFGSGVAVGGAAGAFFGPIALSVGIVLGGIIAMTVKAVTANRTIPTYKIEYNLPGFNFNDNDEIKDKKNAKLFPIIESNAFTGAPDPNDPWGDKWKNKIKIFPNNEKHIFRNKPGHLPDTKFNRELLVKIASDSKNYLGTDKYGNQWFAKTLANGEQIWVSVRNNLIRNGGLNSIPQDFNPFTGLCKNIT